MISAYGFDEGSRKLIPSIAAPLMIKGGEGNFKQSQEHEKSLRLPGFEHGERLAEGSTFIPPMSLPDKDLVCGTRDKRFLQ